MRKQMIKVLDWPLAGNKVTLAILLISFFLGSFAACILVSRIDGADNGILNQYFSDYFSALRSAEDIHPELWSLFWDVFCWPLLIVVLGISPIGLLCIPVVFLARGFLLSFSIAALFRVLGGSGLLIAFSIFGISGAVCVPILFVLGIRCFVLSGAVTKRLCGTGKTHALLNQADIVCIVICIAGLCAGLLVEYCLVPNLLLYFSNIIY